MRHLVLGKGAYDLITQHGRHLDAPEQYVRAVRAYDVRIGNLQWAAPQDWPFTSPVRHLSEFVVDHVDLDHELDGWVVIAEPVVPGKWFLGFYDFGRSWASVEELVPGWRTC